MTKVVSNEDFDAAYNNLDNKKIINKVKKKYRNNIPKDELDTCGLHALWHTLRVYDSEKSKFTSLLYKMVNWKCNSYVKKKEKELPHLEENFDSTYEHTFYDGFQDHISILPQDLADIIEQRILYRKSITDIGRERNIGFDAVKSKLDKAYRILKKHANRTILK